MEFTIRVYAFLFNEKDEVLLLDETYDQFEFTKLPGGGLEIGEGILAGLERELQEELGLVNLDLHQLYTTEKFVASKIQKDKQVIAVYYWSKVQSQDVVLDSSDHKLLALKWVPFTELSQDHFTFETDHNALSVLKEQMKK